ncbi:MAG: mechanosensitive ion channel family protein [Bacteroidales bacterium]|jgi:MscS family membrane protein|nr:mechanosensitive ion channel family protein [Bacteroidales bacterium]NCU35596.1 mechanosensitive ion channel family protein [Candidatus Falkowbacteria bacterium]MDD2632988.1 mechanosensitive ion channel family protein [Bacteroidales bacterium]MDD3130950.1 mechanosensitive ion channel family protein [Bacteroidales bacterium]MDD3528155.1 mechanosensitive ion channel family protein [Bacteroidales bacterium]
MEKLELWFNEVSNSSDLQRYLVLAGTLVALFFIGKVVRLVIRRLSKKHLIADSPLYAGFLEAVAKSATILLLSFGLIVGLSLLSFPEKYDSIVATSREILMVIGIGVFVFQLVEVPVLWFEKLIERRQSSSLNMMFIPVIRKTLKALVVILILLQIIQILSDKPITTIIAGLGIGSLAIALAAQDTIKHFIGSFVIAGDKPFDIGDRVVVDGHDGSVESIGLRSTSIRTLEGHLVAIPNGELANRTIQNIGKRPYIRRLMNVTVTYDTPPEKIQEGINIIKQLLDNHEGIHANFPPRVYFNGLNSASLNILALYWYHPPDYWKFMDFSEKLNFEIISRFNAAGIDFAFPTQTIYVAGDKNRPLDFGLRDLREKEEGLS